jgi:hypothetical protein
MTSVYHIATIHVNETSWAHVWRLRFCYLGTGYDNDAYERGSYRVKALVPVDRLQALLVHMRITTTPKYRIKGVPRLGRVEFRAIAEIFSRSRVISRHQGPAF